MSVQNPSEIFSILEERGGSEMSMKKSNKTGYDTRSAFPAIDSQKQKEKIEVVNSIESEEPHKYTREYIESKKE